MSFTTYAGLKTAIAAWLNRDDLTSQIPDFVSLATATLNKVLRDRRMAVNVDIVTVATGRAVSAPADMLGPIYLTEKFAEQYPLEQVSPERLMELRRTRFRSYGQPRYYATIGAFLELCPTPLDAGTLDLHYYAEIPALSADGDTNWVLTDEPDIYLYTALLHAAVFLGDPGMAALIRPLLETKIVAAVGTEAMNSGATQ